MNSKSSIVFVLKLLFSFYSVFVHGQSTCCPEDRCCDISCAAPHPVNLTLNELATYQPLYVNLVPVIPLYGGVDSECFTLIPLPDGSYLLSVAIVYSNGFLSIKEYTNIQEDLGVFGAGSTTCNFQVIIFDYINSNDCTLFLAYVCRRYKDCHPGDDIPVFGMSPSPAPLSQDCIKQAVAQISRGGVEPQDYFTLPYNLPTACVTHIPCSI